MSPELESKRLILRHWRDADLEPFAELNQDPAVMEFFPKKLSTTETKEMMDRISGLMKESEFGLWAVELKNSGEFLGFIGMMVPTFKAHFTPCVEIGWRLKKSAWGRGYASEGAKRVLQYAFEELKMSEVVSLTCVLNQRSWKVMERIGMTRSPVDDFEHPRLAEGHWLRQHVLYRMSVERFLDLKNKNLK